MRFVPPNSRFIFQNRLPDAPGGYRSERKKESPEESREEAKRSIQRRAKEARRGMSLLAARELDRETVEAFHPLDKEKLSTMKPDDFMNLWIQKNRDSPYLDLELFVQDNNLPPTFVPEYRAFLERRRLLLGDAALKPTESHEISKVWGMLSDLLGHRFRIQAEDGQIIFFPKESYKALYPKSQTLLTKVKIPFAVHFRERRKSLYRGGRTEPFGLDYGVDLIGPDGTTFPIDYTLMHGQDTEALSEEERSKGKQNDEFADYVYDQFLLTLGPEMQRAVDAVSLDLIRGGYKIYERRLNTRRNDDEKPLVYEIRASKGEAENHHDPADDKREIHLIIDRNGHIEVKEIEVEH